jgi:hypothetical protein
MTTRVITLLSVSLLLLAACGKQELPSPRDTLARPTLTLASRAGERVLIPRAALVERGGIPGVFVLHEGEARFRMVKRAKEMGDRIEIQSGLDGNESLVLGDLGPVRDGSPITSAR